MQEKVVIDTNIWISYFIKKRGQEILDLIINNNLIVYSDTHLRNELLEVITREKFRKYFTAKSIEDALLLFDGLTTFVKTKAKFIGSPDPKDDFLYDLCFQTTAKYLVTGDRKLLLYDAKKVKTISLTAFKTKFI